MISNSGKSAKAFWVIRSLFFACALFFPFLLSGAERAKNIPGIDPLPLAGGDTGPEAQDDSGRPATNTSNLQMDPADPGFPKVRNLTVTPEPGQPYTAKLSWDLYPDASTPVYVVRYSKPITNRALLLEAYNLTSPPLAAGTKVFLNRNMPEGVYYYAVVTAFELSREGRLELRAGQNYTVTPFIVYRENAKKSDDLQKPDATQADRDPNLKPEDFSIKKLSALDTVKGVVLNWPALSVRGVEYEILRSAEPLDSAERIDRATRLGKVSENTPFYTDEGAVEGKRMYYGVIVRDTISGKVYRDLKFRESYIEHTYRRPKVELQYDSFLPESLTAFLVSSDTIQLIWIDPGPAVKEYRVYRNSIPITTAEILASSEELGTASPGSGGFRDEGLSAGTYYYALFPVTTSGELLTIFQPGRTFTMFGVRLRGARVETDGGPDEGKDSQESSKQASLEGFEINRVGDDVRLSWTAIGKPKTILQVYRAEEPMNDPVLLQSRATLIGEVPVTDGQAIDQQPGPGDHYYSLAEFDPDTKEYIAVYYSSKPLTMDETQKEEEKEGPEERLQKILSESFTEEHYAEAEKRLEEFLTSDEIPGQLRSKGLFYLGIVKFRLKKYSEARDIFKDPVAQAHDRDRALFWYRISLERMKQ